MFTVTNRSQNGLAIALITDRTTKTSTFYLCHYFISPAKFTLAIRFSLRLATADNSILCFCTIANGILSVVETLRFLSVFLFLACGGQMLRRYRSGIDFPQESKPLQRPGRRQGLERLLRRGRCAHGIELFTGRRLAD